MRGKRGRGTGKKMSVFLLRYPYCPSARRDVKVKSHEFIHSNTCFAKELLPIIRDFADLENTTISGELQSL
ncbi:hypothetical protein [Campylobacter troglodytis]|uniref:hypothetical protein n=1 Tax=Campylobacter troglodytis TaxID=654363 RepID=UPI00115A0C31|nr:hypothetical protein [Campylobacter troglodytis]